jgi:hypothetical protein
MGQMKVPGDKLSVTYPIMTFDEQRFVVQTRSSEWSRCLSLQLLHKLKLTQKARAKHAPLFPGCSCPEFSNWSNSEYRTSESKLGQCDGYYDIFYAVAPMVKSGMKVVRAGVRAK